MRWTREYALGREIPRFYGLAYDDWATEEMVFLPIPFNVVVRVVRDWWSRLKRNESHNQQVLRSMEFAAYNRGLEKGKLMMYHEFRNLILMRAMDGGIELQHAERLTDQLLREGYGPLYRLYHQD